MEGNIASGLDFDMPDFQDDSNATEIQREIVAGHVSSAIILLFLIIGFPWNALVLGIILKKKLFTQPSSMLLLNLASSNFLACLLIMPFPVAFGMLAKNATVHDFPVYDKVCQSGILFTLLQLGSIYTVALMSVDKVIYLRRPLTYQLIVTPRRMLIAITILWTVLIVISILPLLGVGRVGYVRQISTCIAFPKDQETLSPSSHIMAPYFVVLVALGSVGTLVQLPHCICMIYITRKQLMTRALRSTQSDSLRIYSKRQLQLVKLFGAIFTASLITTLPAIALGIKTSITGEATPSFYLLFLIAYISVLSKSVIYPILEAYMAYEIRDAISELCKSSIAHLRRLYKSCR